MSHSPLNSAPGLTGKDGSSPRPARRAALPLRYLIVGGTAYVVEMASLWLLTHAAGLRPLAAVAISFWIGFLVAFILQKLVAFQNYERDKRALGRQLLGYAGLVAFNYLFTLLMVQWLQRYLPVAVVRTGVIALTTIWNYLAYKRLFRR